MGYLWDGLNTVHALTDGIFKRESEICKTVEQKFLVTRYLEKLGGAIKDVRIILNAANSPRLRRHFKANFSIETVDPIGPITALLPSTTNGWENVAFKALEEINREKLEREEIEWEAVASKVRADAQRVSFRAPSHNTSCIFSACSSPIRYLRKNRLSIILGYPNCAVAVASTSFDLSTLPKEPGLPPRVATTSDATHGNSHQCRKKLRIWL